MQRAGFDQAAIAIVSFLPFNWFLFRIPFDFMQTHQNKLHLTLFNYAIRIWIGLVAPLHSHSCWLHSISVAIFRQNEN